jgi:hypothetical protein
MTNPPARRRARPARWSSQYASLKAEIYWGFRQRLEAGDVGGLTDERSIAQLSSIRYSHNARGQVAIESKDELARRGVKSPDRAEAVILAFGASKRLKRFDIVRTIRMI